MALGNRPPIASAIALEKEIKSMHAFQIETQVAALVNVSILSACDDDIAH
jgi:hypothetical protein